MRIGVPREIRHNDYRVAMLPEGVRELVAAGNSVTVESGAGLGCGYPDEDYVAAGARLSANAAAVWNDSDLIVKVKKPIESEFAYLRPDHVLLCYLHLAVARDCTNALLKAGTTSIGYELVETDDASFPLLQPMSEIAGSMAPHLGAQLLQRKIAGAAGAGGMGLVLGGVVAVPPARVVVLGAGVAGTHAARVAAGMMADVVVLDTSSERLKTLSDIVGMRTCKTVMATAMAIEHYVIQADLVIGAVMTAGQRAPKLVSNKTVRKMRPGSVVVDLSIDQGGCFEASRPTSIQEPVFEHEKVVFCCIPNVPSMVPRSASIALANLTLPHVASIARDGWREAVRNDKSLARGLNTHGGRVFHHEVSEAFGFPCAQLD